MTFATIGVCINATPSTFGDTIRTPIYVTCRTSTATIATITISTHITLITTTTEFVATRTKKSDRLPSWCNSDKKIDDNLDIPSHIYRHPLLLRLKHSQYSSSYVPHISHSTMLNFDNNDFNIEISASLCSNEICNLSHLGHDIFCWFDERNYFSFLFMFSSNI